MPKKKTRLLIVDDSAEFREAVVKQLADNPNIEAKGSAFCDFEEKILSVRNSFDAAVVDLGAEETGRQELLRQLGESCPVPYIVMSADSIPEKEALSAGAAGIVKKPRSPQEIKAFCGILGTTAIIASANKDKLNKVSVVKSMRRYIPEMPEKKITDAMSKRAQEGNIVVLGASTGGTDALECVIKAFPQNMPPVLVVQHMPPVFTKMYAERLNKSCTVQVKEAVDGDRALPGTCIIAAGDSHLELKKDSSGYYIKSTLGEKVSGHCPSVDVLFSSAAETAGPKAIAALLTGMGADGAKGMLKLHKNGAYTIGQDKESCIVYGMPMEAHKLRACSEMQPLDKIGARICSKLAEGW